MKRKIIARITAALAVLALLCSLCGCGESIVGKWRSTSEKETQLIFVSTGKVTMSADGIELAGTFTDDGQNLVLSLTAPNGSEYRIEASYVIDDGSLYLENSKGQVEVFVR